ncbi:DUF2591 family protein [Morganella morganii]
MNKYRDKSDFEINKAVAEITIYGDWYLSPTDEQPFTFFNYGINSSKTVELPDYCNNPADAMPIILDNKIDLTHLVGDMVCAKHKEYWCIRKNPYRAGCEVYLLMKDAENEKS